MSSSPTRVALCGLVAVSSVVWLTACASAGEQGDDSVSMASLPIGVPVRAATAALLDEAGYGRAIAARTNGADITVVSTTGVHLVDRESAVTSVAAHLPGHWPSLIAFSPFGDQVASFVAEPGGVQLQQVDDGSLVGSWPVPLDVGVSNVWFEPTTERLIVETSAGPVIVGPDGVVQFDGTLLPLATGRLGALPDGTIVGAAIDSTDLVSIAGENIERYTLDVGDGEQIEDVSVSPDGATIGVSVSSGDDGFERRHRVILLDSAFAEMGSIETEQRLDPLNWTLTNDLLVTAVDDELSAWSLEGAKVGQVPAGGPAAALHPLDAEVVVVGLNGSVDRWDGRTGMVAIAPGGVTTVFDALDVDERSVTTVDFYGRIEVRSVDSGEVQSADESFAVGEITSIAVADDGSAVAAVSTAGGLTLFDPDLDPQAEADAAPYGVRVDAVAFDPTSGGVVTGLADRVGTGAFDDTVVGWTGQLTERFRELGDVAEVPGCSFFNGEVVVDPTGSQLFAASHDFGISVIDPVAGDKLDELPGSATVVDLAISEDGSLLVATREDGVIEAWDATHRELVAAYRASQPGIGAIAILPQSDVMAVADLTGALTLIDVTTGNTVLVFDGLAARTRSIAVTPDGSVLAAPTPDGTIGFWSTDSGAQVGTAPGHVGAVTGLAFGPDGTRLYSASDDGTVRSWSVELEV